MLRRFMYFVITVFIIMGTAHAQDNPQRPIIAAENLDRLRRLAWLDGGAVADIQWADDGQAFVVVSINGVWGYRMDGTATRLLQSPGILAFEWADDQLIVAECVTYDSDLFSGDCNQTRITIIALTTFSIVEQFDGPPQNIRMIAVDNTQIAFAAETELWLFKREGHQLERVFEVTEGDDNWIWNILFSPDGQRIFAQTGDGWLQIVAISTKEVVGKVRTGSNFATSADYLISDRARQGRIDLRDWQTGNIFHSLDTDGLLVTQLAVSPDEKYLMARACMELNHAICTESHLYIWDMATLNPIATPDENIHGGVFHPTQSGEMVLTRCSFIYENGVCFIYDIVRWQIGEELIDPLPIRNGVGVHWIQPPMVSPRPGTSDYLVGQSQGGLRLVDSTGAVTQVFSGAFGITEHLVFSPDSRFLATAGWENDDCAGDTNNPPQDIYFDRWACVRVWDMSTFTMTIAYPFRGSVIGIGWQADGQLLVINQQQADSTSPVDIEVVAAATGEIIAQKLAVDQPLGAAFLSPDTQSILLVGGGLRLWRFGGETLTLSDWSGGSNHKDQASFSPDGQLLVTSYHNATYPAIWDTTTGQEVTEFEASTFVERMFFMTDGTHALIEAGGNKTILWDRVTNTQTVLETAPDMYLSVMNIHPNNTLVLAGGGRILAILTPNADWTGWETPFPIDAGNYEAVFSPDGALIAAVGWEGGIEIWGIPTP